MRIYIAIALLLLLTALTAPCYATRGDSIAVPTEWYVNSATGSNASSDTPWGRSEAYPFASVIMAVTNAVGADTAIHDTIWIYANADSTYTDYVTANDKHLDFVGIGVSGESCTLRRIGGQSVDLYAGIQVGYIVDGFKFDGPSHSNGRIMYRPRTFGDTLYVRNCLFTGDTDPLIDNLNTYGDISFLHSTVVQGVPNGIHCYNNAHTNTKRSLALANTTSGYSLFFVDQCTFRDVTLLLSDVGVQNIQNQVATFVNCIVDADTYYAMVNAPALQDKTIAFTNCDTMYVKYPQGIIYSDGGFSDFVINSLDCFADTPVWRDSLGDADYPFCYWEATEGDSEAITGSTDGSYVGVLWGYSDYVAPSGGRTTGTYAVPPYYRQILWRF